MGIVHLAPLGTNPGAVTAALSYLKHNPAQFNHHREKGAIVESLVLFASHEVVDGKVTVRDCVFNEYARPQVRRTWDARHPPTVLSVVRAFVEEEIAPIMPPKGKIYLWPVNPNDFNACFECLADATLALGDPAGTGKHLWANLTGGTNILNAAVFDVASLSGLIAQLYYTFVRYESHRRYLQPPTRDPSNFLFTRIPLTKTAFDAHYYRVLHVLRDRNDWCADEDLLSRLKGDAISAEYFGGVALATFRTQFLNRMDGCELERDDHRIRLTEEGLRSLQRVENPRFQALIHRGRDLDEDERERLKGLLKDRELWSK